MLSVKYDLSGPKEKSSHLATIVSRALQPHVGRIPCPGDRNLEILLTSHIDFLFIFGQCGDNCILNLFLKRKVGVTERPRSLHDVACEFACAVGMRSNNLARTSLVSNSDRG